VKRRAAVACQSSNRGESSCMSGDGRHQTTHDQTRNEGGRRRGNSPLKIFSLSLEKGVGHGLYSLKNLNPSQKTPFPA